MMFLQEETVEMVQRWSFGHFKLAVDGNWDINSSLRESKGEIDENFRATRELFPLLLISIQNC